MVTAQLICSFVLAYASIRFSNDAAQITSNRKNVNRIPVPADQEGKQMLILYVFTNQMKVVV